VKRYLEYVQDQSRLCFAAGMDVEGAADAIDISDFADWKDRERIVVNVAAVYRDLDPGSTPVPVPVHLERMARWRARH
jgi:cyclase